MPFNQPDRQSAINLECALNPTVGDYWHEMYMPVCQVIEVGEHHVIVLDKLEPVPDTNKNRWKEDEPKVYTREQFAKRYRYGSIGNPDFEPTDDLTNIKNCFWPDCMPAYEQEYQGEYSI